MRINPSKSKIMIMNGKGMKCKFMYKNEELEIVEEFVYLGVKLTSDGKFKIKEQFLLGKAKKAEFMLDKYIVRYKFHPLHVLKLFEILIITILNYCSEVWGFEECKLLETYHLKFI